jgi:predicted ferric reductase
MEVTGFFVIAQYLFIVLAILLLSASLFTPNNKKTLHQLYLGFSIFVGGLTLIVMGLLFNLGGRVGAEDWAFVLVPTILVLVLLIKPVKKAMVNK